MKPSVKRDLTIAGSDSCGGAGIQADLKTFHQFGCFGLSVLTAVTAQDTTGVQAVERVSAECVAAQLDAVVSDIGVDAVKLGMLATRDIVEVLADKMRGLKLTNLVVDPVLRSTTGQALLEASAREIFSQQIIPLATVITPNLSEAEVLAGRPVSNIEEMKAAAKVIYDLGASNVVVKGGHLHGDATDLLFDGTTFTEFPADRLNIAGTHGTGCTFSAALAAGLAIGKSLVESVRSAKLFVRRGIKEGFQLGRGMRLLNPFVTAC